MSIFDEIAEASVGTMLNVGKMCAKGLLWGGMKATKKLRRQLKRNQAEVEKHQLMENMIRVTIEL